ncbi:hypothetical protein Y695_02176 [Hydrogenophaga sp. T4]|nr:hypothetical protein Y695_02176 [Hydrogenophaga sp. T4]
MALTVPSIVMAPPSSGAEPSSSAPTDRASMSPVSVKKVSRKERVGVDTVRLPTLTTPPDPTRKPWGLAKKTLPPILLPLIELSMPLIVTRESVTMLIRLALPPGRCMLTTCPPPTAKVENELKALDPLVVEVCTLVAPPLALTVVWVRPSGWMLLGPAVAGGPSTKPALSASSAVILRRPVPDLPRPLAISATAVQIMRASFQTRRYRRLTDEWRCMTGFLHMHRSAVTYIWRQSSRFCCPQDTYLGPTAQAQHPPKG